MGNSGSTPNPCNHTNADIEKYHEMQRDARSAKEKAETEVADAQKRVEEAAQREAEAKNMIQEAENKQSDIQHHRQQVAKLDAEVKEANAKYEDLKRVAAYTTQKFWQLLRFCTRFGIQPETWPTEEEYQSAKTKIQFDPEKIHFGVCGASGSGKSSLINAFRGLKDSSDRAAPTGTDETTLAITRHPDPREEMPYNRLVWVDCPGAGTLNIPGAKYFNQQGLFIFDVVVLVYDAVIISINCTYLTPTDGAIYCSVSLRSMCPSSRTATDLKYLYLLSVPRPTSISKTF